MNSWCAQTTQRPLRRFATRSDPVVRPIGPRRHRRASHQRSEPRESTRAAPPSRRCHGRPAWPEGRADQQPRAHLNLTHQCLPRPNELGWRAYCQVDGLARKTPWSSGSTRLISRLDQEAHSTQRPAAGLTSNLTSGISIPQPSHMPYVPARSLSSARSISPIEAAIDLAVAVVDSLSTASVVPSPTRFPNDTAAVSVGGAVRRPNSASSSALRAVRSSLVSSGVTHPSVDGINAVRHPFAARNSAGSAW